MYLISSKENLQILVNHANTGVPTYNIVSGKLFFWRQKYWQFTYFLLFWNMRSFADQYLQYSRDFYTSCHLCSLSIIRVHEFFGCHSNKTTRIKEYQSINQSINQSIQQFQKCLLIIFYIQCCIVLYCIILYLLYCNLTAVMETTQVTEHNPISSNWLNPYLAE